MSTIRGNPLHLQVTGNIITPDLEGAVQDLWERVLEGDNARQEWIRKQEKLIRQRRGIRKRKVMPWPGANNHNWPLTDAIIRRWKPGMAALVSKADPITYFVPTKPEMVEAAPLAQKYFHWRFTTMDGVLKTVMELTENLAQYGVGYTRQGWDYRTEKNCRVVNVNYLFPNGVQAAVDQTNEQLAQARAQAQEAIAAGEAPPEVLEQIPQEKTAEQLVMEVLEDQYILRTDDPLEASQLAEATEKILDGASMVKFYYTTEVTDKPCWKSVDPLKVFYPPRNTDPDEAEYIGIIHQIHTDSLRKMALDGKLDPDAVDVLADKIEARSTGDPDRGDEFDQVAGSSRSGIQQILDQSDGVSQGDVDEPNIATVIELYCHLDIDNDGLLERCVVWFHPETKMVLSLTPFTGPFKEWPVVKFEFEHTSTRHYSPRGIAELVTVFQGTVNKLHNSRLDAIQITLSPMLQKRSNAGRVERSIRFMPGAIIPVQTVGDIAPLQMDTSGLLQSLNEENVTKGLAEQYIGTFDPGVLSQNAQDRRTATEIEAVLSQTQTIFSNDADLFQAGMAKVFSQIWKYDNDLGREDLFFRVTGEEEPIQAKRHEIAFDFDIVPAGTPANTSQPLQLARVREAISMFINDPTGVVNKRQLYKRYFDLIDHNLGRIVIRDEQEAALFQQMQQAVAAMGQEPAAIP